MIDRSSKKKKEIKSPLIGVPVVMGNFTHFKPMSLSFKNDPFIDSSTDYIVQLKNTIFWVAVASFAILLLDQLFMIVSILLSFPPHQASILYEAFGKNVVLAHLFGISLLYGIPTAMYIIVSNNPRYIESFILTSRRIIYTVFLLVFFICSISLWVFYNNLAIFHQYTLSQGLDALPLSQTNGSLIFSIPILAFISKGLLTFFSQVYWNPITHAPNFSLLREFVWFPPIYSLWQMTNIINMIEIQRYGLRMKGYSRFAFSMLFVCASAIPMCLMLIIHPISPPFWGLFFIFGNIITITTSRHWRHSISYEKNYEVLYPQKTIPFKFYIMNVMYFVVWSQIIFWCNNITNGIMYGNVQDPTLFGVHLNGLFGGSYWAQTQYGAGITSIGISKIISTAVLMSIGITWVIGALCMVTATGVISTVGSSTASMLSYKRNTLKHKYSRLDKDNRLTNFGSTIMKWWTIYGSVACITTAIIVYLFGISYYGNNHMGTNHPMLFKLFGSLSLAPIAIPMFTLGGFNEYIRSIVISHDRKGGHRGLLLGILTCMVIIPFTAVVIHLLSAYPTNVFQWVVIMVFLVGSVAPMAYCIIQWIFCSIACRRIMSWKIMCWFILAIIISISFTILFFNIFAAPYYSHIMITTISAGA